MEVLISYILSIFSQLDYWSVFVLMTIESSFIPFPSELVIPPAAFLAQQGQLNIYLVVLVGILGSIAGALVNYYLAMTLGRKVVYGLARSKFAKFLLINEAKVEKTEQYFIKYGKSSTFFGRLVPWVRQFISIPAGFSKMSLKAFVFFTGLGSGLWVVILAVLGYQLGANQELLMQYFHELKYFILTGAAAIIVFFIVIKLLISKKHG